MDIYGHIEETGSDDGFVPKSECQPTDAKVGSREKLDVMRDRLSAGQPLWHPDDSRDFARVEDQIRQGFRRTVTQH